MALDLEVYGRQLLCYLFHGRLHAVGRDHFHVRVHGRSGHLGKDSVVSSEIVNKCPKRRDFHLMEREIAAS